MTPKNSTKPLVIALIIIVLSLFSTGAFGLNRDYSFPVTDGVTYRKIQTDTTGVIRNICILKIDYSRKDLVLSISTAAGKSHEGTLSQVKRNKAVAGINGGYFDFGAGPVGLVMCDGKMIRGNATDCPPRGAIGFTSTHRIVIDRVETPAITLSKD